MGIAHEGCVMDSGILGLVIGILVGLAIIPLVGWAYTRWHTHTRKLRKKRVGVPIGEAEEHFEMTAIRIKIKDEWEGEGRGP